MDYISRYVSPLGGILLAADEDGLFGLWFEGQKYFARGVGECCEVRLPVFESVQRWLDIYFSGDNPGFVPPLHLRGTAFQREVWALLLDVPFGQTVTYGELARLVERRRGMPVSARAVGGAVGHNRVSLIVPCHRVVGAGGSLTGYAGGLERKAALLRLEGGLRETEHT